MGNIASWRETKRKHGNGRDVEGQTLCGAGRGTKKRGTTGVCAREGVYERKITGREGLWQRREDLETREKGEAK